MPPSLTHLLFDLLAASASAAATVLVYRWRFSDQPLIIGTVSMAYPFALLAGAVVGGYALGTTNVVLSGQAGIGRSILGALLGAIAGVEAYKLARGIRGSTGIIFVPAFCATVIVGRVGCTLSGMEDFTYGMPTTLPWGLDLGDGVARHPVALYESLSMALFLVVALVALGRRSPFFFRNGFYLMTGWYALQRFGWEFLKPYGTVAAGLNVFHLAALALGAYAIAMIGRSAHARQRSPA